MGLEDAADLATSDALDKRDVVLVTEQNTVDILKFGGFTHRYDCVYEQNTIDILKFGGFTNKTG
jgi:hypothetical protein